MWWGGVAEPAPDASIRINMRQCLNHARDHGEFAIKKYLRRSDAKVVGLTVTLFVLVLYGQC